MSELRQHRIEVLRIVSAVALIAAASLFSFAPALAQDADEMPARVGRLAEYAGQVYLAPEDRAGEWAPIGLNYPITTGDSLWISGEGRAEIDFGGGQFRLAGDTNVHVSRLDEREFSLFVAQGSVIVRVRSLDPGEEARIDTPNSQVLLARPGLYRIDVSADRQETTVVVREGEAIAGVTNGTQQILPGQTATLFGAGDVQADVRNGTGLDGFDAWSSTRDRRYSSARSTAYVSPQMVGYADLDQYGAWQTYPEYGPVWFPTSVAVEWAPYRYGRWVSLPAWGWTWVDDAPWGYAPFHYGRWAYIGGRWGWAPGTYVRRPVWAPALVAWYGGGNWAVGIGVGGPVYGWVPLGWREPYIPSWRNCGSRCWAAYNRPYAVNVSERPRHPPSHYANQRVPGAVTAVPGAALAGGKPVGPNRVHFSPNQVTAAPILPGAPQVKPVPVTTNIVRPGNGVPPPAATIASGVRPMPVPSARPGAVGGAAPSAPIGRKPSYASPASPGSATAAPPATQGAITAVPPGANRASPAYNPAETAGGYNRGRSNVESGAMAVPGPRPAPSAVAPSTGAVTGAPAARYQPPQAAGPGQTRAPQATPVAPGSPADASARARPQSTPAQVEPQARGYAPQLQQPQSLQHAQPQRQPPQSLQRVQPNASQRQPPPQAAPAGPMPPVAQGTQLRGAPPPRAAQPQGRGAGPQGEAPPRGERPPPPKPGGPVQAER